MEVSVLADLVEVVVVLLLFMVSGECFQGLV